MEDSNTLGNIIGWKSTIRFAFPSILTMLFVSSYSIVDGAFVSNLVGTDALAAINILMPVASIITGLGFMFATGGSAYVANLLGKGESERASRSLSLIVAFVIVVSLILTLLGLMFMDPLATSLGADERLFDETVEYGRAYIGFTTFLILQFIFTQMLIVAGRPRMSLAVSIAGGVTNIILDYLFLAVMDMGLTGAAVASGCSSLAPTIWGTVMFIRRDMPIRFIIPSTDLSVITSTCSNGISEMASELTGGITTLLYNMIMMKYIGPDGVSAITIMMYVQFLAIAIVIGYSNGVAPLMSYNHGRQDRTLMNRLYRTSMIFVCIVSIAIFLLMEVFGSNVISLFANESENVMEIATHGTVIFSFAFLMMGFNVYASSLFTSLSNGPISALISLVRSLVCLAPSIVILPLIFGIDSIWYAVPLTELITLVLSSCLMLHYGKRYGFLRDRYDHMISDPRTIR